jgi:hypothetical protein
MDKYVLFINSLILISILSIVFSFIVARLLRDRESEFVVNYNVLMNLIEIYKETILLNKINLLSKQYDLNEKSQTNSIQAFEKAKSELISESVKEIIKVYLSKDSLNSLLQHYNIDGLSLLIVTHLKR